MKPSIVVIQIKEEIQENNLNPIDYLQEKIAFIPQTSLLLIDCSLLLPLGMAVTLLKISLIFHSKCL